ncbi:hypothetical protein O983_27295 [Mycobacterium avium 09-5983]|nr:hypothetical protein O983_27295 [Mycobacterium avium 09-5983]KDP00638.1 hypothetical protein MAV3388_09205 [Mycobacterium avium subsp. hominissuis 3388]
MVGVQCDKQDSTAGLNGEKRSAFEGSDFDPIFQALIDRLRGQYLGGLARMSQVLKLVGNVRLSLVSWFLFVFVASAPMALFLALANHVCCLLFNTFFRVSSATSAAFGLGLDHAPHLLNVRLDAMHYLKQRLEWVLFVPKCRPRRRDRAVMLLNNRARINFGGLSEITR